VAGGSGVSILVGFEGVKGQGETGRRCFSGGVKVARRRFDLALHGRRRAAVSGAQRSGTGHRRRRLCRTKEGDDPLGRPSWAGVATLIGLQLGQSGLNGPMRGENKAMVRAKLLTGCRNYFENKSKF
jgi:hypothetical protein